MERGSRADGKESCSTAWILRFRVPDTEGIFFSMEEEGERFLLEYREGILKAVIPVSYTHLGTAVMLVTHDAAIAARTRRVLFLSDGRVAGELRLPRNSGLSHAAKMDKVLEKMRLLEI